MQKYYNPRLHNAVVAGTGMEHPRRPHVVLGSELNGYVQGDLVDANGICDLIHEKNVDTFAKLESLETSLKNESKARIEGIDNLSEQIDRTIAEKLGSTETVYGESVQRAAEDERLQSQINDLNSKYTALYRALNDLSTTVVGKQDALVAGNNIKNISDGTNTVSLLGAGDIRFKTINGQSILGDEDIPVAAGDDSTAEQYPVDPNAPMLSADSFNKARVEITTKLGIDTESQPTQEQQEQILNELKSYKFATPKQGNAVLIDFKKGADLLTPPTFTFQCDDGSIITLKGSVFTGLRPDIDGYLIWQTTRDKLPVRENQGETVSSTEEVYTVINNNTGEIVDPLELHKLTNVIWNLDGGHFITFYLGDAADLNSLSTAALTDLYNNDLYISGWAPVRVPRVHAHTFYDYTIVPSSGQGPS